MSVIQFPTKENSGVARARKKFKLLTENELQIKDCPGLDEFLTVPSVNVSKDVFYPVQTVNVPDVREQHLKRLKEEYLSEEGDWLASAQNIFNEDENATVDQVSWTAYHKSKSRDRGSNIPTVNVLLPLIDYKSSAIELQHHLMKISVAYTTYLNPGQIAVGCSDLPLYALKKIIQMSCADVFSDLTLPSWVASTSSKQHWSA